MSGRGGQKKVASAHTQPQVNSAPAPKPSGTAAMQKARKPKAKLPSADDAVDAVVPRAGGGAGGAAGAGGGAAYDVPIVLLLVEAPNKATVKVETTPVDCVLDVRQFLMDCPETCEVTSYHLEHDGVVLNDYVELSEYPQLYDPALRGTNSPTEGAVLKIVPDFYDERAARIHVRRLRDILVNPPAHVTHYTGVLPDTAKPADGAAAKKKRADAAADAKAAAPADGKAGDAKGKAADGAVVLAADEKKTLLAGSADGSDKQLSVGGDGGAEEERIDSVPFSLTRFHSESEQRGGVFGRSRGAAEPVTECVRNINFSAWNPPPGNRQLRGDLLYLEVTTLEEHTLHVTASVDGFFLNSSTNTRFDPHPHSTPYKSHTLVELLRKASPLFLSRFARLLNRKTVQHPFEFLDVLRPVTPWNAPIVTHRYDWNRAEDVLLSTFGMDSRGVIRDWNEEHASCRELPRVSLQERVMRDRTIYRVYSDFVDAATKGGVAIIHGSIPPINPMDPKKSFVYIYNNIFFSYAVDVLVPGTDTGDRQSYAQAAADVRGVAAYAAVDLPELYTLATTLVTYRGRRLIAQSIIPGIFHGDRASSHVYGSMDHGKTVQCRADFHALVKKASDKLHLAEHAVADEKGQSYTLSSCVESKGLIGSDGRKYVLDLLRVFPRDANFPDATLHNDRVLRPELITLYSRQKAFEKLIAVRNKKEEDAKKQKAAAAGGTAAGADAKAASADAKGDAKPKTDAKAADAKSADVKGDAKEGKGEDSAAAAAAAALGDAAGRLGTGNEEDQTYIRALSEISFNPDVFTHAKLSDTPERQQRDRDAVVEISKYLLDNVIPKLVADFKSLECSPLDAQSLTTVMHERGVNIRYLSKLAAACADAKLHYIEHLCVQEMIVRTAKHILGEQMRAVKPDKTKHTDHWFLAPCIAHFLSSFLGPHCGGTGLTDEQLSAAQLVLERLSKASQSAATDEKDGPATGPVGGGMGVGGGAGKGKGGRKPKVEKLKLKDGKRAPDDPLAPVNLWQSIRNLCFIKFGYTLPARVDPQLLTARAKLSMLRSLCRQVGITVASRDYDFAAAANGGAAGAANGDAKADGGAAGAGAGAGAASGSGGAVFSADDILELFPIVKANVPKSKDASDLLDAGKAYLAQGQLHLAYQYLNESLGLHNQVFGPMHADSAACYSSLAMVCYHAMDYAQAVEHQQRAVVISERVLGLDHYDTAHAHSHLALFLHTLGHFEAALKHIRRALYLFELICGPNHPDTAATHINIAMIYQDSGKIPLGLQHLQEALRRNALALGPDHSQVALSHHAIAVAYGLCGGFRNAIEHEKKAKAIYTAQFGDKHTLVQQSVYWLGQFTSGAVKHAKGSAPDKSLSLLSPLTWVSLRSSISFRGRLTMNDVLQLIETAAEREQHAVDTGAEPAADEWVVLPTDGKAKANGAAGAGAGAGAAGATGSANAVDDDDDAGGEGEDDDDDAGAPGGAGGDKTQKRKEKRKRQKKNKKLKAAAEKAANAEITPSITAAKPVAPPLPQQPKAGGK